MAITMNQATRPGTYSGIGVSRRQTRSRKTTAALWTIQGILAVLFLFAGGMKLAMPTEMLAAVAPLPALFLKFIGLCEVAGAFGLILPGLFHVRTELTPVAASGLVIIMAGATIVTVVIGGGATALMPLVIGVLATIVARGRRPAPVRA
jgi:DoxX-like family